MNPRSPRESPPHGLVFIANARIDLTEFAAQPVRMGQLAILHQRATKPDAASLMLHARASRMRDIAIMLSARDAGILEAYAGECEAEAARLAPHELAHAA
jgi:hypothetical protein